MLFNPLTWALWLPLLLQLFLPQLEKVGFLGGSHDQTGPAWLIQDALLKVCDLKYSLKVALTM